MSVVFTTLNIAFSIAYYLELCNPSGLSKICFGFLINMANLAHRNLIEMNEQQP